MCRAARLRDFAEANAFGSNQRIINHARNVAIGETHVFSANDGQPGHLWLQPHLRLHHFARHGDLRLRHHRARRHSQRQPGMPRRHLPVPAPTAAAWFPPIVPGGYWAIGDRGYSPFQGGTNIFSFRDSLDLIRHKHDFKMGIDFRAIK